MPPSPGKHLCELSLSSKWVVCLLIGRCAVSLTDVSAGEMKPGQVS